MGFDYRSVQGASVLDTNVPDNGNASAAGALARSLKEFSNDSYDLGADIRQKQGTEQGSADGSTGTPQMKAGLAAFTIYGKAYNNSATRSYAIQSEATAEDTAAKLQVEANNDPALFAHTYAAARDATLKAAPPEAQAAIANMYNQRLASGVATLSAGQAQQQQKSDRVNLAEGVSRLQDRVAQLRAQDDPAAQQQADEEQVKLNLMIDGARNTNTITETEKASMHLDSQRAITVQTTEAQFARILDDPHGDPVSYIENFEKQNRLTGALDPDEAHKITQNLFATLRQHNELESMGRRNGKTEEQIRLEAGDRTATGMLFSGQLTTQKLYDMVVSQNLKPEVARALNDQLTSGDKQQSDPKTLFEYKTDLLDKTPDQIRSDPHLAWKDKALLTEELQKRSEGWEGTQASKEAKSRIDRALGIVPGTQTMTLTDSEKTQRQTALTQWYDKMSAVDPAQRESQAIPLAQTIIANVIRTNSSDKVRKLQSSLSTWTAAQGDVAKMGSSERAEYDKTLASYQRRIAAAQAEGARAQ